METNTSSPSRLRRAVDDLIIAEMFLVQATIESASAMSDGLSLLGRQITSGDDSSAAPANSIAETLQGIAAEMTEPYTSRFRYLRNLVADQG